MVKSKRKNYLIDKPFQLGFIFKYLLVILITVLFCFGVTALHYYYDNLFGDNKVRESVTIKYHKPLKVKIADSGDVKINEKVGYWVYNLESKGITVYQLEDGTYKVLNQNVGRYNPSIYSNEAYSDGNTVELSSIEVEELKQAWGPFEKQTQRFFIVIFPLLFTCLAIMVIIAVYSLFFSHKMAGPIYRMRVSLDRMLAGDYDFKIKVRKNDFFRNIVEKIELLRVKQKGE